MLGLVKSLQESLKEGRWEDVDPNLIMKCASLSLQYQYAEYDDGTNLDLIAAQNEVFGTTFISVRGRVVYLRYIGEGFLEYLSHVMDVEVEKIK